MHISWKITSLRNMCASLRMYTDYTEVHTLTTSGYFVSSNLNRSVSGRTLWNAGFIHECTRMTRRRWKASQGWIGVVVEQRWKVEGQERNKWKRDRGKGSMLRRGREGIGCLGRHDVVRAVRDGAWNRWPIGIPSAAADRPPALNDFLSWRSL